MARVGGRYDLAPNSHLVLSGIYNDRNTKQKLFESTTFDPVIPIIFELDTEESIKEKGYQGELQYVYQGRQINITAGFGLYDIDRRRKTTETETDIINGFPPIVTPFAFKEHSSAEQGSGYVYSNITYPEDVTWTIGFSYVDYDEDDYSREKLNPKLGLQWNITEDLLLRVAVFRAIKPALVANQTIEPTQVAGLNQFFDDANGSESGVMPLV